MTDVIERQDDSDDNTLNLLQKIQSREIDPKNISKSARLRIVQHLVSEAYGTAEIAKILSVADRTIERDRKLIKESNAVPFDSKLPSVMVGRLMLEADHSIQKIRKAIRGKDVPPQVVVDGHRSCFQISSDLTRNLQSLGYLPIATHKIQADLIHHESELPGLGELELELQRLLAINKKRGIQRSTELTQISDEINQVKLHSKLKIISQEITEQNEGEDQ